MQPVSTDLLKRLKLKHAVEAEAESWQNAVPPMPGWGLLSDNSDQFAKWIDGQLRKGLVVTPAPVLAAKKFPHGMRAVPIWGPVERVVYRALTDFLLRNQPPLDRSPDAYLKFVGGPIEYAREHTGADPVAMIFVGTAVIKYVVKSDVVSFYEYVDHGLLGDELLALEGDYEAVECLLSLLGESQGKSYGLPQMLDPSDRLSEIYVDQVERAMIRRGWPIWRFNDDFRIAVESFTDAQVAIEDLAAAARACGLTLSDFKTTTPKFTTYASDAFGLDVDSELPQELANHEPEDFVGDYTEGVGADDNEWAISVLDRVQAERGADDPDDAIVLSDLSTSDFRALRRALSRLIRDPGSEMPDVLVPIVGFAPALTPWVMRLVTAGAVNDEDGARDVVGTIASDGHLNHWQLSWVLRTIADLNLLDGDAGAALRDWVAGVAAERSSAVVEAEAAYALSTAGLIGFSDLDRGLSDLPDALLPVLLAAVRNLNDNGSLSAKQLKSADVHGKLSKLLLST